MTKCANLKNVNLKDDIPKKDNKKSASLKNDMQNIEIELEIIHQNFVQYNNIQQNGI